MEILDSPLTDLLLQSSGAAILQFDADERLLRIVNGDLYRSWLAAGSDIPTPGTPLSQVLSGLFDAAQAARLLQDSLALDGQAAPASQAFQLVPGRLQRLAPPRWFDVVRTLMPGDAQPLPLLLITDRTQQQTLADTAARARASQELALTVLRTDAARLRQFLQNANSALGFIRSTLRQPSRTQAALRDKLSQLHAEATSLTSAASELSLRTVALPAQELVTALDELLALESATGDDLLPLARRIDALSAGIAETAATDEQRAPPSGNTRAAAKPRSSSRATPAWHETCEQRANELIQRLGNEYGVLARLRMKGTALVPERYHRQIDAALEPLIDNALKHGIEPPEARLAADKLAAGTITVTFRSRDADGLEMTVHDDGRGFDLARIRAAAVACGLVTADQGDALEPRELVGVIFKPGFSTQSLSSDMGTGRGMALLRESLQRRGGNVSVATKSRRYTQFTLRFANGSAPRQSSRRSASP